MARAISNKNVLAARFTSAEFDGEWKASIGKPELRGSWCIYGKSGSGKTTFILRLAKYLSQFVGCVAVNSLEQGLSLSLQTAWQRVGLAEVGNRVVLLEKESYKDLMERLDKRRSPDVVIIDSVHYWLRFSQADYIRLKAAHPNKLFIFIAQERNGEPKGAMADHIKFDSDVKIHVEGFVAYVTTRYEVAERGEGGSPYVIWQEGARRYHSMQETSKDNNKKTKQNGKKINEATGTRGDGADA